MAKNLYIVGLRGTQSLSRGFNDSQRFPDDVYPFIVNDTEELYCIKYRGHIRNMFFNNKFDAAVYLERLRTGQQKAPPPYNAPRKKPYDKDQFKPSYAKSRY
jgi:hypothetical protein